MTELLFSRVCVWIVSSAIVPSLSDGMFSFKNLCDSLLSVDADLTNSDASVYERVRELIVRTQQDMEKTEREAERALRKLDEYTEYLTAVQVRFERRREEKRRTLDSLNTQLNGDRQALNSASQRLQEARNSQENAEDVLRRLRERERSGESQRDAGIGVSFIGWTAGPIMAVSGAEEMEEAERASHVAREEVDRSYSNVQYYNGRISDYQSRISDIEYAIRQTDEDLKQVKEEIVEVKQQREALAEFQKKMRSAVHLLGRLSETADVLELQTRRFILLEPVMKVMEDVVKVAGEITGHQILQDEGGMSLVDAIRETNRRLAAVYASEKSQALENYY